MQAYVLHMKLCQILVIKKNFFLVEIAPRKAISSKGFDLGDL